VGTYFVVIGFRFRHSRPTIPVSVIEIHDRSATARLDNNHNSNRKDGQSRAIRVYSHADAFDARVTHLHRHCHDRTDVDGRQQAAFHSSWARSVLLQGTSIQPYANPSIVAILTIFHRQIQAPSHPTLRTSSTTSPRMSTSTTSSSRPSRAAPKPVTSRTSTKSDSGRTAPETRTTRRAPKPSLSAPSPRQTSGSTRSVCGSSRTPAYRRLVARTCRRV
jgi:hypothetical protein